MTTLIFDIETNGFLDVTDTIHSLCIKDADTDVAMSCTDNDDSYHFVSRGLRELEAADIIVGHNIIGFDLPAIKKVVPSFAPQGVIRDTYILSLVLYPDLRDRDFKRIKTDPNFPKKLIGSHGLKAWGYRLGVYKDEYTGGFDAWSKEMQDYCEQDVEVTAMLWAKLSAIIAKHTKQDFVDLEHQVAEILRRQEANGISFDVPAANHLCGDLIKRRAELATKLAAAFPPWTIRTPFVPKANNSKYGYEKGVKTYKENVITFNPSSRYHIADRLKDKYQWKPTEFTPDGHPKVDDDILAKLKYPEAELLAEYFVVEKRLGQLAEGPQAWTKKVSKETGRIHGRVITNGAVTGRMTHKSPNLAQVPSNSAPYGEQCRALFGPRPGWVQVGADADALELRCLAHFMAKHDDGEYVEVVLKGDKAKGTDMHSVNCRALGMDPSTHRDIAKTWFYAFIYGAGDYKLGTTKGVTGGKNYVSGAGRSDRGRFLNNLPALGKLVDGVRAAVSKRGYLTGMDGRRLHVRSEHAALNTLLQSAGAVLMKQALVMLDDYLQTTCKLVPGVDYEFMLNIHDEWQIECKPELAELVGNSCRLAMEAAAEHLGFRCPVTGQYEVGNNWAETH